MGTLRTEPLDSARFVCPRGHKFDAPPGRVEEAEDRPWHPWAYFCACPTCGEEAKQAPWEIALLKGWANATGPRTEQGLARSAANLQGHPTPEESRKTRFNAIRHGLRARVATYFPARPGKYPHCEGCEYLEDLSCLDFQACLKRTELFMKHQAAFESKNPELLSLMRSDTHAALQALINDMVLAIAQDGGPRLKTPDWFSDKDGGFHLARYLDQDTGDYVQLYKLEEHPLLKRLIDFVAKNNMTLGDQVMTPKSQDEEEAMRGYVEATKGEQSNEQELRERQTAALEQLSGMIERSQKRLQRDPILIEHEAQGDG